jgi:hypothetical protein
VGKTKQLLTKRIYRHKRDALECCGGAWTDKTHRANWLRQLYLSGNCPEVVVLEEAADLANLNLAECEWIEVARCSYVNLVNETDGGDGGIISRKPAVADDVVIDDYRHGLSSKLIAKKYGTCKKRVLSVIRAAGVVKDGAKKSVIDDSGNTFESIQGAADYYGVSLGAISNVLRGKARTSAGHTFRYLET